MKGFFYSIIALAVFVPLIFFALSLGGYSSKNSEAVTDKILADQLSHFVSIAEDDYEKAVEISALRALAVMVNYEINSGEYLDDAETILLELMTNGTMLSAESSIMEGNTIPDWVSGIESKGAQTGIDISITMPEISFADKGRLIEANSEISIEASGARGMSIKKDTYDTIPLYFDGIEDPTYSLNTLGRAKRFIDFCPFECRISSLFSGDAHMNASGIAAIFPEESDAYAIGNKSEYVLITQELGDASLENQFAGVISEADTVPPGLSAPFMTGAEGAVYTENLSRIYFDSATDSAWNLENLSYMASSGCYCAGFGSAMFQRIEGNMSGSSGIFSFVNAEELSSLGLSVKENSTATDCFYFGNDTIIGYSVNGLDSAGLLLDDETAGFLGVSSLLEK